ncbi:MAG TPA: class I SAM-dependent methyltransferase [Trebonia sp.]|jgi:SAM-dependent methyltransferase
MVRLAEPDAITARNWIERWERQQEVYMADREERFTALVDAVEAAAGRPDPLVLDLGCGPGSLAVRLLARLPRATVVAVDADPVTLSLGRAAYGDLPGLVFADIDLRAPGGEPRLGLPDGRQADAVVSTTALHWLSGPELSALYGRLAGLLRPGGLFLDGDHLRLDESRSPVLAGLERELEDREARRRFPDGHVGRAEDWGQWWRAVAADPALADAVAARAARGLGASDHASTAGVRLDTHVGALRDAGFAEVGTVWQRGSNRLLCAVR